MTGRRREAFSLIEAVIVVAIITILLALVLAGVMNVRQSSLRAACGNNMRQLGLAFQHFVDTNHKFPSGVNHPVLLPGIPKLYGKDKSDWSLMPWTTFLLPYIEQDDLWKVTLDAYVRDHYFLRNPPHVGRSTFVPIFLCPADGVRPKAGINTAPAPTSYLGVEGVSHFSIDGILFLDSSVAIKDILDGTSNTVLVGERPASADGLRGRWYGGWGYWGTSDTSLGVSEYTPPGYSELKCEKGPYYFQSGTLSNRCDVFHFWSFHNSGANFLFADGAVRFLSYDGRSILPALATRAGGEIIPPLD
jgi:prepilin-type processing-associated H-X9-DG protein